MPPPPATGGIWLNGDGSRALDATGKTILDNSCGTCCCTNRQYRVVVAGTTLCLCPIPNGPLGAGDLFSAISFTGSLDGTWYLPFPGPYGLGSCLYSIILNPPPIRAFLNKKVAGVYVCGPPYDRELFFLDNLTGAPTFGIDLFFFGAGFVQTVQFTMGGRVHAAELGGDVNITFASGQLGGGVAQVCDTFCPLKVIALLSPCQWIGTAGTYLIHPGQGGTATIDPQ